MEVKLVWRRSQCGGELSVEVKLCNNGSEADVEMKPMRR